MTRRRLTTAPGTQRSRASASPSSPPACSSPAWLDGPPMTRRPVTQRNKDQVLALHAEGLSRNEIARRIHRSGRTVSRIADELGLTFERGEATEARKADARSKRAVLATALLDDAERLRQQLFTARTVYSFGGWDNTFERALINEPSFRDKREIMSAVGIAIDRAIRLDEYDADSGIDAAKSRLGMTKGPGQNRLARAFIVSRLTESNRRPTHYECVALPSELRRQQKPSVRDHLGRHARGFELSGGTAVRVTR